MSMISDALDGVMGLFSKGSSGGGFGDFLSTVLPAAITGVSSYLSNQGAGDRQQAQLDQQSVEAQKDRDAQLQRLMLQLQNKVVIRIFVFF